MKKLLWVLFFSFFAVAAAVVYVWVMQNANEVALFRLDLASVGAWEMTTPMQVTRLMGVSFGAGFVLAGMLFTVWGLRRKALVRRQSEEPTVF